MPAGDLPLRVLVPEADLAVSALARFPESPRAALVLAHGAGAGMRHRFMEDLASALAERSIAAFRFQFPYMEQGSGRPDRAPILTATVRAAVLHAREVFGDLPLLAGGKSLGGRMTTTADAERPLGVRGIVCYGFPLHPAGRPGTARAEHLSRLRTPTLFLQGGRDKLADLDLLRPIVEAHPHITLAELPAADHGWHVLKRSGMTENEALGWLAEQTSAWAEGLELRA